MLHSPWGKNDVGFISGAVVVVVVVIANFFFIVASSKMHLSLLSNSGGVVNRCFLRFKSLLDVKELRDKGLGVDVSESSSFAMTNPSLVVGK